MSQLSKAEQFFSDMIDPGLVLQDLPLFLVAKPVPASGRTDMPLCDDSFPISLNKTKNGMARPSGAPSWKGLSLVVLSGPGQGRERKWKTSEKKRERTIAA